MSVPCVFGTHTSYSLLLTQLSTDSQTQFQIIRQYLPLCFDLKDYDRSHIYMRKLLEHIECLYPIPNEELSILTQSLYNSLFRRDHEFPSHVRIRCVETLSTLLSNRFKKQHFQNNLVLEWRPLLDYWTKHCFNQSNYATNTQSNQSSQTHRRSLISLINRAERLFDVSKVDDILDELSKYLSPYDNNGLRATALLRLFLPLSSNANKKLTETQALRILKLFDNNLDLVDNCNPSLFCWMYLFMRLSKRSLFLPSLRKELQSRLPLIFNKYLQILELDIGSHKSMTRQTGWDSSYLIGRDANLTAISEIFAKIVIAHLPSKAEDTVSVQILFAQLAHTLYSYLNPTNSNGRWAEPLSGLLQVLGQCLCKRLHKEMRNQISYDRNLFVQDSDAIHFCRVLVPLALQGLFAKSMSLSTSSQLCLRALSSVYPSLVFVPFLGHVSSALTDVNTPQRLMSVLPALGLLSEFLFHRRFYPQGASQMEQLLWLALPGIDSTDPLKSAATMSWIAMILYNVPLVDKRESDGKIQNKIDDSPRSSAATIALDPSNEEIPPEFELPEESAQTATLCFSEWALALLTAVMKTLDSAERLSKTDALDQIAVRLTMSLFRALFNSASDSIADSLIDQLLKHLMSMGSKPAAAKQYGAILCTAAQVRPTNVLGKIVPLIKKKLFISDEKLSAVSDDLLSFQLYLLGQSIKLAGGQPNENAISTYVEFIETLFKLTRDHKDKNVRKSSAKLVRNALRGLTSIYPAEWRIFEQNECDSAIKYYNLWCCYEPKYATDDNYKLIDPGIIWHIPSQDELKAADKLLENCLEQPLRVLVDYAEDRPLRYAADDKVGKFDGILERSLIQVQSILRGATTALGPLTGKRVTPDGCVLEGEKFENNSDRVPLVAIKRKLELPQLQGEKLRMAHFSDVKNESSLRTHLLNLFNYFGGQCIKRLGEPNAASIKTMSGLIRTISILLFNYNSKGKENLDTSKTSRRMLAIHGSKFPQRIRSVLIQRTLEMHNLRIENAFKSDMPLTQEVFEAHSIMNNLCIFEYEKLRAKADNCLMTLLTRIPVLLNSSVQFMLKVLKNEISTEGQIIGTIHILCDNMTMRTITRRADKLLPYLTRIIEHGSKRSEDRVQIMLTSAVLGIYSNLQPPILMIKEIQSINSVSSQQLDRRNKFIKNREQKLRSAYYQLLSDLLNLAQSSSIHWRYQLLASSSLYALISPTEMSNDVALYGRIVTYFTRLLSDNLLSNRQLGVYFMNRALGYHVQAVRVQHARSKKFHNMSTIQQTPFSSTEVIHDENVWLAKSFFDFNYSGWNCDAAIACKYAADNNFYYAYHITESVFTSVSTSSSKPLPVLLDQDTLTSIDHQLDETLPQILESFTHDHPSLGVDASHNAKGAGDQMSHAIASHYPTHSWPFNRVGALSHAIDPSHIRFVKLICNIWPHYTNENSVLIKQLREMIDKENKKGSAHELEIEVTSAEILVGILKSLRHATLGYKQHVQSIIEPLLIKSLNQAQPDCLTHWTDSLRRLYSNTDPFRLAWLTQILIKQAFGRLPGSSDQASIEASSTSTSKRLRFVMPALIEHGFRARQLAEWAVGVLKDDWLRQPFKQVREEIALVLLFSTRCLMSAPSDNGRFRKSEALEVFLSYSFKQVQKELPSITTNSANAMSNADFSDALAARHFLETHLSFVVQLTQSADISFNFPVLQTLLSATIQAQSASNVETAALAKFASQSLSWQRLTGQKIGIENNDININDSLLLNPQGVLETVVNILDDLAQQTKIWQVKVSVLKFLHIMLPRHQFILTGDEIKKMETLFISKLLIDPQIEVREACAVALSALISSCLSQPQSAVVGFNSSHAVSAEINSLQKKCMKLARIKVVKGDQITIARRHGGVLGLSGLILAHPYDLPPFVPPLLKFLSNFVNDSPPISTTIRKTFTSFNNTHRDEWETLFKQKFTEDELDALNSVTGGQSYFA